MAKYYCVLFDADNTLLDFDAAENKALTDTLREYGIEPDAETVVSLICNGDFLI